MQPAIIDDNDDDDKGRGQLKRTVAVFYEPSCWRGRHWCKRRLLPNLRRAKLRTRTALCTLHSVLCRRSQLDLTTEQPQPKHGISVCRPACTRPLVRLQPRNRTRGDNKPYASIALDLMLIRDHFEILKKVEPHCGFNKPSQTASRSHNPSPFLYCSWSSSHRGIKVQRFANITPSQRLTIAFPSEIYNITWCSPPKPFPISHYSHQPFGTISYLSPAQPILSKQVSRGHMIGVLPAAR
jgi:hypothetical protein